MPLASAVTVMVCAMLIALGLCIASQIWTSKGLSFAQRSLCLVPLCTVSGVLFAALVLALLRPELFAASLLRPAVGAWGWVAGLLMMLLGVYYTVFADFIAKAQEDMVRNRHWWTHLYLRRKPHAGALHIRAVILLIGGICLCANSYYW